MTVYITGYHSDKYHTDSDCMAINSDSDVMEKDDEFAERSTFELCKICENGGITINKERRPSLRSLVKDE